MYDNDQRNGPHDRQHSDAAQGGEARSSGPRRPTERDLLTPTEAGEYLATGERFIRRLIAERRIAYIKVGKFVRIERSELDRFVDAGRVSPVDQ